MGELIPEKYATRPVAVKKRRGYEPKIKRASKRWHLGGK